MGNENNLAHGEPVCRFIAPQAFLVASVTTHDTPAESSLTIIPRPQRAKSAKRIVGYMQVTASDGVVKTWAVKLAASNDIVLESLHAAKNDNEVIGG